uniref:Reverse transcriptase zinc-binding domain-containing protein n=1 Tax=Rhizophagus irregularis (strain DAOM 181602 / DAOM 197198 / MUCL 43194) TaxID=747089 RepID=U9TBL8_RHIID
MSFDDFNLYWKKHLIPGGIRAWRKKCSELIWKNEMLNSRKVEDLFFYNHKGEFDWNRTLQFISNRNSNCTSWEIEKEDVWERSYKIKNFLKDLPTYEVFYKRDVNKIETDQCIRCKNGVENWDHLWICEKNELTIKEVIERSISDFEEHLLNEEKHEEVKLLQNMNFSFLKILYEKSEVLIGKEKYWELIRGVYNRKFNTLSKDKDEKELINELWVFCFNALKKEF